MCIEIKVEDGPIEYYGFDEFIVAIRRILSLTRKNKTFRVVDDRLLERSQNPN
jgi:hypothetical protein